MAKNKEEVKEEVKEEKAPTSEAEHLGVIVKQPPKVKAVEPVVEAPVYISFDRWFAAKGFKPHWKAGMVAFTDTTMRKTFEEWESIFKKY